MSKKKLVLTGASGFLGHHFLDSYCSDYQVVGTYSSGKISDFPNLVKKNIDFSKTEESTQFFQFLEKEKPDYVLNFAAAANPNFCELNPNISAQINIDLPVALSKSCQFLGIKLVHVSTDLVFDGEKGNYKETDELNPISVYGKHKKITEKEVLKNNPNALVCRLPLMFGISPNGGGFLLQWVERLQKGEDLFAFADEFRTAASASRVVGGIKNLIDQNKSGIWHLGGKENVSRLEFANRFAAFLKIKNPNIISSLRANVTMPAARPKDVSLNSQKAFSIGHSPLSLEDEFQLVFK